MPQAFVSIRQTLPLIVDKNDPVGARQVTVEITVRVDGSGCYAFAVYLFDRDRFGDDMIASNLHEDEVPCYCLKKGESYKFVISGAAGTPRPAPPGTIRLEPPLKGKWPESDGPFDDTLEVFAKVEVYYCRKACSEAGKCEPRPSQKLDVLVGSGIALDSPQDVTIRDGHGTKEGIELLKEGAKAGAGALMSELPMGVGSRPPKSLFPGSEEVAIAFLARRIDNLQTDIVRLAQGAEFDLADRKSEPEELG